MLIREIGCTVIESVDNSAEALELIYTESPDLILMDIDIKGRMSGTEIGKKIEHLGIPILYITSFDDEQTYQAAQRSKMVGFLVKPVGKYALLSCINLAISNIRLATENAAESKSETDDFVFKKMLFFKKKNIYHKVDINEITFVESDDKYCITHTEKNEKFVTRITISKMEKSLPASHFIRIHRRYIVNSNKILSVNLFEGTTLVVGKEKELPISRVNRKKLEQLIGKNPL